MEKFYSKGASIIRSGKENQIPVRMAVVTEQVSQQGELALVIAQMLTQHGEMLEAMKEQAKALEDTGHDVPQSFFDIINRVEETLS